MNCSNRLVEITYAFRPAHSIKLSRDRGTSTCHGLVALVGIAAPAAALPLWRDFRTSDIGTVFSVFPSGTETTVYSFDGSKGSDPYFGITLGSDGNFYGSAPLAGC